MESLLPQTVDCHAGKDRPQVATVQVSFMKNSKRKRLAKACDACHKSKRRCDGTAPCSNCFFASKDCTYTDASGRPVPAPKASEPVAQCSEDDLSQARSAHNNPPTLPTQVMEGFDTPQPQASSSRLPNSYPKSPVNSKKRHRSASESSDAVSKHRWIPPDPNLHLAGLEARLLRELIGLFFTHCHPHQMVIHKPSFSIALSQNNVPPHLILAMCATAAPFSRNSQVRTSTPRTAGTHFFQEAVKMMFDSTGKLICQPDLSTVQALCLLEVHEIHVNYSWTKHFEYLELACKIIFEDLEIQRPDTSVLSTNVPSRDLNIYIERECLRRCFWLIYFIDVLCTSCTRKPTRFPSGDISIKLPVDETSFQLGVQTTTSEYLTQPAPNTNCASEFGHLVRILTLFARSEDYMALEDEAVGRKGLLEVEKNLDDWKASLPDHLRLSEDNLEIQQSMFETGSNTGAWCFYFMHACHACCSLASAKAKYLRHDLTLLQHSQTKDLVNKIRSSLGHRIKCLNWLVASILWPLSRDFSGDSDMRSLDVEYEISWGFKVMETATAWMKHNRMVRKRGDKLGRLPVQSTCAIRTPSTCGLSLAPMGPAVLWHRERQGSSEVRKGGNEDGRDRDARNDKGWVPSLPSLKSVGLLETRTGSGFTEVLTSLPPLSTGTHW